MLSLLIVVVLSRERFDWKRVVVSSSGSLLSVAFAKVTCVLFVFSLNFLFLSLHCFVVQTGLVDTGSADRCGGARCYLG